VIDGWLWFSYICAAYWAMVIGLLLLSAAATLAQPRIVARRAHWRETPPVSVVLPVKLLEEGFAAAQESALAQIYPDYDVVAATAEPGAAAEAKMAEIFARHPERETRILHSTAHFAASPKVDNLYAPFTQARHDVIFMKDANILLEPGDLAEHMRQLAPDVGLVCGIPCADEPDNLFAAVEAAILNGPHGRILFLASVLGKGFGVGKIMLFRRSAFERAGGFGAISHTVGEDNALAKAFEKIGLRCVFSHVPVRQNLGTRRLRDVYQRQLRWSVVRRGDELYSFVLEPVCQASPAIIAAAFAAPLAGVSPFVASAATFALWFTVETALSLAKGWRVSWSAPAVFALREALMFVVWLHAWTTDRVVWANNRFEARGTVAPTEEG
jgi:ceramide glucosyltransferase